MQAKRATGVGRFSVELEIANNDEMAAARLGFLPAEKVRRETIKGRGRFGGDQARIAGGRRETAGDRAG
jgi:hypothetical protein